MRKVIPAQEVCHVFNSRSQDHARTPSDNLQFNGNAISSYGHYEIGRFHDINRGGVVLLVQSDGYSMTTKKQIRLLREATSNRTTFVVPDTAPDGNHSINVGFFFDEMVTDLDKAVAATQDYVWRVEMAAKELQKLVNYCTQFRIRSKVKGKIKRCLKLTNVMYFPTYDEYCRLYSLSKTATNFETWAKTYPVIKAMFDIANLNFDFYVNRTVRLMKNKIKREYKNFHNQLRGNYSWDGQKTIMHRKMLNAAKKLESNKVSWGQWSSMSVKDRVTCWKLNPTINFDLRLPSCSNTVTRWNPLTTKFETSKHIKLDMNEFKTLFLLLNRYRLTGCEVVHRMMLKVRIGKYYKFERLDMSNPNDPSIIVGCHTLLWSDLVKTFNKMLDTSIPLDFESKPMLVGCVE